MAKIVTDYDIGLVVKNWSRQELAKSLNSIDHDKLRDFRDNLKIPSAVLSSSEMKRRFLEICESATQEVAKTRGGGVEK